MKRLLPMPVQTVLAFSAMGLLLSCSSGTQAARTTNTGGGVVPAEGTGGTSGSISSGVGSGGASAGAGSSAGGSSTGGGTVVLLSAIFDQRHRSAGSEEGTFLLGRYNPKRR